jgi:predicted DNA repair protein MutK
MAGTSLLALLDDIATVLDDVAVMTKIAAKKTAGVLGDDLALNAEQVTGVIADRELPVVWGVAKGSALNKVILVPVALGISAVAHWAITPLLMFGGAFLCYEGFEKVAHKVLHAKKADDAAHVKTVAALADPKVDMVTFERAKVKGAIRTDFILSAEIVVITLGTVADVSFGRQVAVLAVVSALMTVGVYGLVAGIVKLDDAGLALGKKTSALARSLGRIIVTGAPYLMKGLSLVGTVAMFLVGGGIITHGAHLDLGEKLARALSGTAVVGPVLAFIVPALFDALAGVIIGGVALLLVTLVARVVRAVRPKRASDT